jgi:ATP-dependent DNA ligase
VKVKRQRTADCVVIGLAGDNLKPALVLGLRHGDGNLHRLGRLRGVMCHLERTRSSQLQARERLFRRHGSKEKRRVL